MKYHVYFLKDIPILMLILCYFGEVGKF